MTVFITGAEGAGKSSLVPVLRGMLPEMSILDLDVDFLPCDGSREWYSAVVRKVRDHIGSTVKDTVIAGLTRPADFMDLESSFFILLDVTMEERRKRLQLRGSPGSMIDDRSTMLELYRQMELIPCCRKAVVPTGSITPADATERTAEHIRYFAGMVFRTQRLQVRKALQGDTGLYCSLWNDPEVMANVGFPEGLGLSEEEIARKISSQDRSEFDSLLVVEMKEGSVPVGECCLHRPDEKGVARTDVKLLPRFQGRGYGTELKEALLDYLFTRTDCDSVEASPNVMNEASIRMQEKAGGVRVGEDVYHFPEGMGISTVPVHHYIYRVSRKTWQDLREVQASPQRAGGDSRDPEGSR